MALVVYDRVQQTGNANTTVSFTLSGSVAGFQSFAVVGDGNTTYYAATDASGNWEVGLGTYSTTGPTLTRTTILSSSNSNLAVTFSGSCNIFVTYPASTSVYEDTSGNVTPLGTITSGTWNGTTIGVAYGGTGVTTSSGANSVMLRDASQNVAINRLNQANTNTAAAGGTTALTAASAYSQTLTGTGNQTYTMPDATTLSTGVAFIFNNNATGTLTLQDNASGAIGTITAGGAVELICVSTATVAGTWDYHGFLPENVTWGTNALAMGSTVVTGGTWQGGTIASAYGGTGLTTFTAANNALYSTSASALVAGTLPAAAGGTGQSSYAVGDVLYASTTTALSKLADVATGNALISGGVGVAPSYGKIGLTTHVSGTLAVGNGGTGATTLTLNGVVYGNGTSAAGITAAGTTGQVLIATTSGAPSWGSVPTTAAVTSITFGSTGLTPATATTGAVTVAGTLVAANGGTGQSSYAVGDLLYASTTTALSKLADIATGNALISGGVGVAPSYGKIGLTTHVSGILPVANGGTNASTASITSFNNITGYTAAGATGTTSTNLVFSTSPTLVTPVLGTPSSGTLTSCTGLPLTTGVTGTLPVANGGTGVTTSTGSGANVLGTSPSLTTPTIGGGGANFSGSTSGTTNFKAAAAAGATTITMPATTGTMALTSDIPTVNNGTLTMNVSGTGLSGSQTFTANQSSAATFTVTSNATNANTASTIVARDASGNFTAGTITASLSGSATSVVATVTGTNSTELVRGNMADNDQFRILVGGTGSNSGFAEIATADDGTEPIYVRQYSGTFTSVVRTATLLDGSGNTSFPGSITGSSFSGAGTSLTGTASGLSIGGNAATATTATNATNTGITDDTTTNATMYPTWVTSTSGNLPQKVSSSKLTFNPSTGALTSTSHVSSSDETLKQNWDDLPANFVSELSQVKHGTFERIDNGNREVGVSAQSLEKILKEAVIKGEDGLLSVNYGGAALVAVIELAKEIVELRKEIKLLKAK